MDQNEAMIEGGGFTASEVSFRLACMKVLETLQHRFSVKSWRVSGRIRRDPEQICSGFDVIIHRRLQQWL